VCSHGRALKGKPPARDMETPKPSEILASPSKIDVVDSFWEVQTLRGVDSYGMLCSEAEMGWAESAEGLFELPEGFAVGEEAPALKPAPVSISAL
jgi:hypothetical protein